MVYRGAPQTKRGWHARKGIKPTPEDHAWVKTRWMMGFGVRELCALLGTRYGLSKPLSRMTLYWHHRADMPTRPRGRKPNPQRAAMNLRSANGIKGEMNRLIADLKARRSKSET